MLWAPTTRWPISYCGRGSGLLLSLIMQVRTNRAILEVVRLHALSALCGWRKSLGLAGCAYLRSFYTIRTKNATVKVRGARRTNVGWAAAVPAFCCLQSLELSVTKIGLIHK